MIDFKALIGQRLSKEDGLWLSRFNSEPDIIRAIQGSSMTLGQVRHLCYSQTKVREEHLPVLRKLEVSAVKNAAAEAKDINVRLADYTNV